MFNLSRAQVLLVHADDLWKENPYCASTHRLSRGGLCIMWQHLQGRLNGAMGLQLSDHLHSPGHRSRMLSLRDLTPPGTRGYHTAALPHARVTVSVAALLVIQHPAFQELRVKLRTVWCRLPCSRRCGCCSVWMRLLPFT